MRCTKYATTVSVVAALHRIRAYLFSCDEMACYVISLKTIVANFGRLMAFSYEIPIFYN